MTEERLGVLVLHWGRTASGPALTYRIADSLARRSDVRVAISYSVDADISDSFKTLPIPALPIRSWSSAWEVMDALLRLPLTVVRLMRFLRRNEIDVVLVPMDQVLQSLVTWSFRIGGAKYVHCLHDGHLHLGEEDGIRKLLRRIHLLPVDRVVVFTRAVREIAVHDWRLPPDCVDLTHLPPILGRSEAGRRPRALPQDRPVVIGMFGRVVGYKGFDLATEAVDLLRRRGHEVRLRLVGRGVYKVVTMREDWLDIEDRWVDDSEVMDIVGSFDILLLPYREASQSGVMTEAMALGVPVVVTPVGGLVEQVQAGGAGIVAEEVSATAVADATEVLVTDADAYMSTSATELARARGSMGWEAFIGDLVTSMRRAVR